MTKKTPVDLQKRFPIYSATSKYLAADCCGLANPLDHDKVEVTLVDWERGMVHCVLTSASLKSLKTFIQLTSFCNSRILAPSSIIVFWSSVVVWSWCGVGVELVWSRCGVVVELVWSCCGVAVELLELLWSWCGVVVELLWSCCGVAVELLELVWSWCGVGVELLCSCCFIHKVCLSTLGNPESAMRGLPKRTLHALHPRGVGLCNLMFSQFRGRTYVRHNPTLERTIPSSCS